MKIETAWKSDTATEVDAHFTFGDNAYNRLRLAVKDNFKVLGVTYCVRSRHPAEIEYVNCLTETTPRRWFHASEDGRTIYGSGRYDW